MRLSARKEYKTSIPTASMADIAYILIIFFMLTITYEVDKTSPTLPRTELRLVIPKKAAYVSIEQGGRLRVSNGDEISVVVPGVEDVLAFAATIIARDPAKDFVLKADSGTEYRHVDQVIDALKRAKVKVIYLLSDAEQAVDDTATGG